MTPSFRLCYSSATAHPTHNLTRGNSGQGDMELAEGSRYAPQAAGNLFVCAEPRAGSGADPGTRPRVDFLRNVLLMINDGHLLFDNGER